MNILINGACNKNCSFCFEGKEFQKRISNMSLEEYRNLVEMLIKTYKPFDPVVQILGGEPALHPEFDTMLDILLEKEQQGISFILSIITNGFHLEKYIDKLNQFKKGAVVLINISATNGNKEEMVNLIDLLVKNHHKTSGRVTFTPAFTIYDKSILDDLEFLVNRYPVQDLYIYRVTPATPSASDLKTSSFEDYLIVKDYFIEAIKFLNENGRRITSECNQIPTCAYTEEEYSYYINANITLDKWAGVERTLAKCHTAIELMPNGDVLGCIPIEGFIPTKKYWEFIDLNKNHDFIKNEKDKLAQRRFDEQADICFECPLYKKHLCYGGCLTFKDPFPHDPAIKEKFKWIEKLTSFQWKE